MFWTGIYKRSEGVAEIRHTLVIRGGLTETVSRYFLFMTFFGIVVRT